MPLYGKILIGYLIVVNLIAMLLTLSDKRRAIRHRWRIPENTLLFFAAIGGSPAMYLTMLGIRHKTKHKKFMIGIPLIFIFQMAVCIFLMFFLPAVSISYSNWTY